MKQDDLFLVFYKTYFWAMIFVFYFLVTPVNDVLEASTFENDEITRGCKLEYLGFKSTCYGRFLSHETVTIKYPFLTRHEYKFTDSVLAHYSYHRFLLSDNIDDKRTLEERFPDSKKILVETKELFRNRPMWR